MYSHRQVAQQNNLENLKSFYLGSQTRLQTVELIREFLAEYQQKFIDFINQCLVGSDFLTRGLVVICIYGGQEVPGLTEIRNISNDELTLQEEEEQILESVLFQTELLQKKYTYEIVEQILYRKKYRFLIISTKTKRRSLSYQFFKIKKSFTGKALNLLRNYEL